MKKANLKGYTLYDSNQMTFWKRQQNYGDSKKYQELEVRREEQEEHRGLFRAMNTVYGTIMMDTFVQTHGRYTNQE